MGRRTTTEREDAARTERNGFEGKRQDSAATGTTARSSDAPAGSRVRVGRPFAGTANGMMTAAYDLQDRLVAAFEQQGVRATYYAFAFVFVYFGLQKLIPGNVAPVTESIALFVGAFGVPIAVAGPLIGCYEVVLGALFLTRRLRLAFFFFLAHQFVTLLSLVVIPAHSFQPPWIAIGGIALPWSLDWFAAFVLKNLVFVGAFMLLASYELGGRSATTSGTRTANDTGADAVDH